MWLWIWLAVTAVSLVIELITFEMVSVWFVVGGIVAMILAAVGVSLEIQLVVFFALSIILLVLLRKITIKYLLKNSEGKTNTDLIIGTQNKLIKDIKPNEHGLVKINDVEWRALSNKEDETIKLGTLVEVLEIKGNKLIVKKVSKKTVSNATTNLKTEGENK